MEKLLVTYSKSKEATYLSHLDIMAVFSEALLRASIPVKFSNGFNPRPDIVFAHPLSVGIESTGEMFEIVLTEHIQPSYYIKEMNKVLPSGLTIMAAEYIDSNSKSIMSRVYAATYILEFVYDESLFAGKTVKEVVDIKKSYIAKMKEYLDQDYLLVLKKSKNRMERIDIKPQIIVYDILMDGSLEVTVSTGSRNNLKPEYIMIGFNEYIDEQLDYNIKRTKILYN